MKSPLLHLSLCTFLLSITSCTYYFGPNKLVKHFKDDPQTVSAATEYNGSFAKQVDYSAHDSLIEFYANKQLPEKKVVGHTDAVRIMIAKLIQKREIEKINAFIMQLTPWSGHGTQWALHPHGDYDFTEITWCSMLYLFGEQPDVLYPATRTHLVNVLIGNSGNKQALRTPNMLGAMRETENHILMGEISRYLKNQWLHEHGDTTAVNDNNRNGMDRWIINHVSEKFKTGFYEFNSDPYSGYAVTALNTLFSFTHSDTIRNATNKLLNELVYEYSLSSINESRYPPFRRQIHRASRNAFDSDPVSSIVRVLVNQKTGSHLPVEAKQHGLMTLLLHYRLNNGLASFLTQKNSNYFARLGHGRKGSPEIYSAGKGFVISAGGVQRGHASQLAARPTILLLNDHVMHRDSCFYICSKGKMERWNNTGVYQNFAVANDSLHIPPQYLPAYQNGNWKVFQFADRSFDVITCRQHGIALMLIIEGTEETDPGMLLSAVILNNKHNDLRKAFTTSDQGDLTYELNSPKNKWVIKSLNGKLFDRKFDKWPRLQVKYKDHISKI